MNASADVRSPTASLAEALALADSANTVREAALLLRERFAPLRVIVVDAFDMRGETPAASGERRLLWGAVSDGHCWQISTDLSALSGFYLADKA
ncbi:hypothetical protein KGA65_18905 [Ideonella sp. B7]|uniref:hypothetical protein n=1 Tax=Ideonella benzenivorans TaxID=2831643 RepID=UPI001CEDBFF4|nr:hypothetical protein [Ideonella benzenivorans]MCA6218614.1 hypothetical protein [Ideonella benzenivorans]